MTRHKVKSVSGRTLVTVSAEDGLVKVEVTGVGGRSWALISEEEWRDLTRQLFPTPLVKDQQS